MSPELPGQLDALDLATEAAHLRTDPVDIAGSFWYQPEADPAARAGERPPVSGRLPRLKADGQPPGVAEREDADEHA